MDEVDGMSGNQDRAGMAELIALIKSSHIPIICICNDRQSTKVRSLANYCFDLRFHKPQLDQIRSRLMSICAQERMAIAPAALDQVITGAHNDVRQSIQHLNLLSADPAAMDEKQTTFKDVSVVSRPQSCCPCHRRISSRRRAVCCPAAARRCP